MKFTDTLSILLAVSTISHAEREETVFLFSGTPDRVIWDMDKNDGSERLNGNIYFSGFENSVDGYANWNIPAFDTQGGTRTMTGFRVNYGAGLQATFNADAQTTHNRKIEGYDRWASIQAEIRVNDFGPVYSTHSFGAEFVQLPTAQQKPTLAWNLDLTVQESGWTLRTPNYPERAEALRQIALGNGTVNLTGNIFWSPYFTFVRKEIGTNRNITAYADTGTNDWSIPNEDPEGIFEKTSYPVDAIGRRINAFIGMPGYPAGEQPQNLRSSVMGRAGAALPLEVSVTYFFTTQGDGDHGRSPYLEAGKFASDFEYLDTLQLYFNDPANTLNHRIPGNKELEYAEFQRQAGKPSLTGGIQLFDFSAIDKKDPVYGLNMTFHFLWMDADRNGTVSMKEYRNWRTAMAKAKEQYQDPGKYLPDANWASVDSPPDADAVETDALTWKEEMLFRTLDESGNGQLYKKEWMHLYAPPKKGSSYPEDGSFEKVDANNDQIVTREEIAAIPKAQMPLAWRKGLARTELFAELDGKNKGKKDNKLTLPELRFAFKPGTKPASTKSTLKRMAGGKLKLPVDLRGFLAWETVPLTSYETATEIRKIRKSTFYKIRGTSVSTIDRARFGKLFKKDVPKEKIDQAWLIATGTKKGHQPPTILSLTTFLKCRLIGAKIK